MDEVPKLLTRFEQSQETPDALRKIWGPPDLFQFDPNILMLYKKFKHAGIPQEQLDLGWDDFQNATDKDSLIKVQDFADLIGYHWRSGGGLLLIGLNGTGKSFLSYMVAKVAITYKIPTMCFTLVEYLEARRLMKLQPDLMLELMKDIEKAKVIVIDDFGKEYGSGKDWSSYEAQTALFNVFKEGATKCVILNTALRQGDFEDKAGTSMLSRFSRFRPIAMSGKDFRKTKIDSSEFKEARAKETDHTKCYQPHPLLTLETCNRHDQNPCLVCKYRFHPTLCMMRFKGIWRYRDREEADGTGTARADNAQASSTDTNS